MTSLAYLHTHSTSQVSPLKPNQPRTSLTHPINISWLLTPQDTALIERTLSKPPPPPPSLERKKRKHSIQVSQDTSSYNPIKRQEMELSEHALQHATDPSGGTTGHPPFPISLPKWPGNFALSSCPGKKVRLELHGATDFRKASVSRDVSLDLARISMSQISLIFCLLSDQELRVIGVVWTDYLREAQKVGITILRLPIIEGRAPDSVASVNELLDYLDSRGGVNVLCHCRGGIGRAGVIAVCYLLRKRYFDNVRDAVAHLRARRSQKAIETNEQMNFLHRYLKSLQ